jgi:D-amino peptidase
MDIYGAYLGELGIPIGFVSGEDIAVKQALEVLPWTKSVVVDKRKETYTSGEKSIRYLKEGRALLRQTAQEAVRHASQMQPLMIQGPLHFEAVFRTQQLADKFNTWDFKQTNEKVEWESENMIDGFDMLNKLTFIPPKIYPFRKQFAFLLRNYFRIKNTYFTPKPNSEEAAEI